MCHNITTFRGSNFTRATSRTAGVPDAVVHHPWWPGGRWAVYRHLFGWAFGDGRLMDLHPVFSYRRAPCAVETSAVTAVAGVAGCAIPLGAQPSSSLMNETFRVLCICTFCVYLHSHIWSDASAGCGR